MTEEQLKDGEILNKTIKTTEEQLENLKELLLDVETKPRKRDNKYDDGMYWLAISEHGDGSGKKGVFTRYGGNKKLLKVIISELEAQLDEYRSEFENL